MWLECLLVVLLAQPFDPLETGNAFGYPETASCSSCHPRHYREWLGSVHAVSSRRLLRPYGSFHPKNARAGDLRDRACLTCHGDGLNTLLSKRDPTHPVFLSHSTERAVTCVVCHQLGDLARSHPEFKHSGPMSIQPRLPGADPFHESKPMTDLRKPEHCGPCHEVTAPNGLKLERTFSQYLESPYPERTISCQTCHMASYGGKVFPAGPYRGQVHRHDMIGSDVSHNTLPAVGSQVQRVRDFLRASVAFYVYAPEAIAVNESTEFVVEVINSGSGHNLPAGFPAERRMWVEVEVTLDDGTKIFRSGHSQALEESAKDDPRAVILTDRFLDESGEEVLFWWQAKRIDERSLRALETRRVRFPLLVSEETLGGAIDGRSVVISARLRFQACSPKQLRFLGMEDEISHHPIFTLGEYHSGPVALSERLWPENHLVVPDRYSRIADALSEASDGDVVLVQPGRFVLDESLRVDGKSIILRSSKGADLTEIRLSGEAPTGSLLIVEGGGVVGIEGFTFVGGRGTLLEDRPVGGAILAIDSGVFLRGNTFRGNVAADGAGVSLIRSHGNAVDTLFEENRASQRGGALFVDASSSLRVSDSRVIANRAEKDGGGIFTSGRLEISGSILRGNRAFRGGALASVGTTANLTLRSSRVLGNAAPLGGGIVLEASSLVSDHCILAGNVARLGGAAYLRDGATVALDHASVTENKASQGGVLRLRGECEVRIRNSIVFANEPPELPVEIPTSSFTHSLVDDNRLVGETNIAGLPFFVRPGLWQECSDPDESGCVPTRWTRGRRPRPAAYGKWQPGNYRVQASSPVLDIGDPSLPPDPDGTRSDVGAGYREQPPRAFVRGDVNADGKLDLDDSHALAEFLFAGRSLDCFDAADIDDRAGPSPVDLYHLTIYHFNRGKPPASPFPDCGVDPTLDDGTSCFVSQSRCN